MKWHVVKTDKVSIPKAPLSQAIKAEKQIFVSGQLGRDPLNGELVGGMKEQTRMCLENTRHILEAAGASLDNVVKTSVFLTDISQISLMNEVYASYFPHNPPSRSCVEVSKLAGGALVEIETVAIL